MIHELILEVSKSFIPVLFLIFGGQWILDKNLRLRSLNKVQKLVDGRPINRIAARTGEKETAVSPHQKIPAQLMRIPPIA
ncbi:MAG: hypothetical protein DHS20C20_09800 [Ardenticatenaceae bacterium]|nr:MAG: hypothetical protein DHS20C20_09800 [Ardenticatenaceae bacterium]